MLCSQKSGTLTKRSILNHICWSTYTIVLCFVSLSRVYLAVHFPHQCLLGMVIGFAVAMFVSNLDTDSFPKRQYVWRAVGLFLSALLTFAVLKIMGFNPMWSVEKALKWCSKREYVHLDTTLFFQWCVIAVSSLEWVSAYILSYVKMQPKNYSIFWWKLLQPCFQSVSQKRLNSFHFQNLM